MTNARVALVVVDEQLDFCEEGALPVPGGNQVCIDTAQHLREYGTSYDLIVVTRDWHLDPGGHFSDDPDYVDSWPPHCVQGTRGAELHPEVASALADLFSGGYLPLSFVSKGEDEAAYSGFEGVDGDGIDLQTLLDFHSIDHLVVVGLALSHCVKATALDGIQAGRSVEVVGELTAPVTPEMGREAIFELEANGVRCV